MLTFVRMRDLLQFITATKYALEFVIEKSLREHNITTGHVQFKACAV